MPCNVPFGCLLFVITAGNFTTSIIRIIRLILWTLLALPKQYNQPLHLCSGLQ